jgi:hypothetical protein
MLGVSCDFLSGPNLIGIDFIRNKYTKANFVKHTCSFGTKFTYVYNDRSTFSIFFETRKMANIPLLIVGGLGVGLLLGKR